ncbi:hypothetical protein H8711_09805 [Clostridiaceae bacterium NSJ-31]|uniref:Uncharacterized protein n=1 Tax=Ligaoa zhengdingensis TaxID=2763658 RepID=A0A926I0P3_9FIRM|nr:hypothetical protein [Ligaoa zhengdingensis]MBC8547217.1 hypothetical protein [Ligaoa zhengdingensis]
MKRKLVHRALGIIMAGALVAQLGTTAVFGLQENPIPPQAEGTLVDPMPLEETNQPLPDAETPATGGEQPQEAPLTEIEIPFEGNSEVQPNLAAAKNSPLGGVAISD